MTRIRERRRPRPNLAAWLMLILPLALSLLWRPGSAEAKLAPHHLLRVSGLTALFAGGPGALAVTLVRRAPGKSPGPESAVPGAEIVVTVEDHADLAPLFSGRTDARGSVVARFTVPASLVGSRRLRVTSRHADGEQVILVTVDVRDPSSERLLHLATDKPMYQAGQVIGFRALTLRALDLHALEGAEVTFEVRAPAGELVHLETLAAGPFGVAVGSFELGPEVPLGSYTLLARSSGAVAERSIKVSSYVLPAYKVEVELDRSYYRPGELVKATVQADYSFGKPVADAEIDLNLVALVGGSPISLSRTSARTDTGGHHELAYRIPLDHWALPKGFERASLSLEVVTRDRAGEASVDSASSVLAEDVLQARLVPAASPMVAGVPNDVYIVAHYPDGKPAADCAVRIVGAGEAITGAAGIARLQVNPPVGKSSMRVELELVDSFGNRTKTSKTLDTREAGLAVRAERALYDPGESARFRIRVPEGAKEVRTVHVELSRRGLLVASHAVPVKDGVADLSFPLGEDGWGTLEAHAHVQVGKTLWSGSTAVYVRPRRSVDLAVTPDKGSYLPGETAKLSVTTRRPDGTGVAAAVMIKVVDERLYALDDSEREKLLLYFTLDEPVRRPDDPVLAEASKLGFGAALTKKEAEKAAKAEKDARERAAGLLLARFGDTSVSAGVLFAADSEAQAMERARSEIDGLASTLRTYRPYYHYRKGVGRPIAWLVKHGGLEASRSVDVWGRSYILEGRGLGTVHYHLISVGPDGKRGGGDDLERDLF